MGLNLISTLFLSFTTTMMNTFKWQKNSSVSTRKLTSIYSRLPSIEMYRVVPAKQFDPTVILTRTRRSIHVMIVGSCYNPGSTCLGLSWTLRVALYQAHVLAIILFDKLHVKHITTSCCVFSNRLIALLHWPSVIYAISVLFGLSRNWLMWLFIPKLYIIVDAYCWVAAHCSGLGNHSIHVYEIDKNAARLHDYFDVNCMWNLIFFMSSFFEAQNFVNNNLFS